MRDSTDDEVIPTEKQPNPKVVVSESENSYADQEGASSPQGAPSPISESEFQNRISEPARFSISPQHSDPPFENWTPTNEEVNYDWKELKDKLSEQEKNVWRKK